MTQTEQKSAQRAIIRFRMTPPVQAVRAAMLRLWWRLRFIHFYVVIVLLVLGGLWSCLLSPLLANGAWTVFVVLAALITLAVVIPTRLLYEASEKGARNLAGLRIRISKHGIATRGEHHYVRVPWSSLCCMEHTRQCIHLYKEKGTPAITIYKHHLHDVTPAELEEALAHYLSHIPAPTPPPSVEQAAISLRRGVAFLIDLVLMLLGFAALMAPFSGSPNTVTFTGPICCLDIVALIFGPLSFIVTWPLLYLTIPTAVWGKTMGKWVMGLRVTTTDGRRPGWGRSAGREALKLLAIASTFGWMIAAFQVALRQRAWYDHVCGTDVKRSRRRDTEQVAV